MSATEIQDLNEWIYVHVFNWLYSGEKEYPFRKGFSRDGEFVCTRDMPDYCHDPATSMELLKKCAEHADMPIEIDRKRDKKTGNWRVETGTMSQGLLAIAPSENNTLELAIAMFACKLFSK